VLLTVHPAAITLIHPRSNKLIEAMANEAQRKQALADIRENIARRVQLPPRKLVPSTRWQGRFQHPRLFSSTVDAISFL